MSLLEWQLSPMDCYMLLLVLTMVAALFVWSMHAMIAYIRSKESPPKVDKDFRPRPCLLYCSCEKLVNVRKQHPKKKHLLDAQCPNCGALYRSDGVGNWWTAEEFAEKFPEIPDY